MRVEMNPFASGDLIRFMEANSGQEERLPGMHVSDLIYCLRKSWARKIGVELPQQGDVTTLLFTMGRALHGRMELTTGETLVQVDGIHGSIDRVEVEDGQPPLPCEIKTTYLSAAADPTKRSPQYFDQLGAYCSMMGVTKGRLYVLYLNGIYSQSRTKALPRELQLKLSANGYAADDRPLLFAYDVEFSKEELDSHWQELLRRKEVLQESVLDNLMPSLDDHWTWECEYCAVKSVINCSGGKGQWKGNFKQLEEAYA